MSRPMTLVFVASVTVRLNLSLTPIPKYTFPWVFTVPYSVNIFMSFDRASNGDMSLKVCKANSTSALSDESNDRAGKSAGLSNPCALR